MSHGVLLIDGGQSGCRARYVDGRDALRPGPAEPPRERGDLGASGEPRRGRHDLRASGEPRGSGDLVAPDEPRGSGDLVAPGEPRGRGGLVAPGEPRGRGGLVAPDEPRGRGDLVASGEPRRGRGDLVAPGLPRRGRDYGVLRALLDADVELVAAGLTGFDGDAAAVARALGVPVIVSNDAVTAHLGALGGEPGVVVVAGTGVIALAVGSDGRWARADGYGALLGDDGGGHWIGRRGLAAALRARDGRPGGSPELLRRAEARFGERIVPAVYDAPDPVAVIASFAVDVADAARAGDETAAAIWEEAVHQLAETARAAARAVGMDAAAASRPADASRPAAATDPAVASHPAAGSHPAGASRPAAASRSGAATTLAISYSGGLFAAGDLLLAPLRAELADLRPPLGTPLDGAARLLERPALFQDLMFEAGAP